MATSLHQQGLYGMIVPTQNAREAAIANGPLVYGVSSLSEALAILTGDARQRPYELNVEEVFRSNANYGVDFADVRGQDHAKRALEVAASGGHNLLMVGPPGSGKTMLARRLPTILPAPTLQEALATTKIHSVAGVLPSGQGPSRHPALPRSAPHHLGRRPHRRRRVPPPGRSVALPPRRAVPRRAARVSPQRRRGPAPAARRSRRHHHAGADRDRLSSGLYPRRSDESLPLRLPCGRPPHLYLLSGRNPPLSRTRFRATPRPHRHPHRSASPRLQRLSQQAKRRKLSTNPPARQRRSPAATRPLCRRAILQRPDEQRVTPAATARSTTPDRPCSKKL